MKLTWVMLLGVGLVAGQADAAQSLVIDNQAIENQSGGEKSAQGIGSAAAKQDVPWDESVANRERAQKGGRLSPRERHELAKAAAADRNKQEGDSYLSANAAKKGVVSLASGVQYRVMRAGKGTTPKETSRVMCRYKGRLIDGSMFDKTDDKKPALLNVAGFVPGLKEAVRMMPTGSKWEIVVPQHLGYGAIGNRGVTPNAVLIYQMEIVSIKQ